MRLLPSRNWLILTLAILGLPGFTPRALADEPVKITILTILATDKDTVIERKIECIAREVQKKYPKLTGFSRGRETSKSLDINKSYEFTLVDKEVVSIIVDHSADDNDRVGLTVKPPQMGQVSYVTACGKFLPIVTAYETKDKKRLIIAIMVQPCGK